MKKIFLRLAQSTLTISLIISFSTAESFGQTMKIYEDIGGSGSQSESQSESDNTMIYVLGGLVIGGVIAYALLRDKDNKEPENDTTSVGSLLNEEQLLNEMQESGTNFSNTNEDLPINLILGVRKEVGFNPENTYLVGLAVRF